LIVLGLSFDLAGAVLLTINAFTSKDHTVGGELTFAKLGTLLLAVGFFLLLLAFSRI
jgi:hypothetical protein